MLVKVLGSCTTRKRMESVITRTMDSVPALNAYKKQGRRTEEMKGRKGARKGQRKNRRKRSRSDCSYCLPCHQCPLFAFSFSLISLAPPPRASLTTRVCPSRGPIPTNRLARSRNTQVIGSVSYAPPLRQSSSAPRPTASRYSVVMDLVRPSRLGEVTTSTPAMAIAHLLVRRFRLHVSTIRLV